MGTKKADKTITVVRDSKTGQFVEPKNAKRRPVTTQNFKHTQVQQPRKTGR